MTRLALLARPARILRIQSVALLLLGIHALLLAWISAVNSPTVDEPAHLASGILHWRYGRFEWYRVNPPLVRMIAAAPVLFTDAKLEWTTGLGDSDYSRSEFTWGAELQMQNGSSSCWYFTLARWALIPVCLAGGWASYRWACELYGQPAGLVALVLYCFCPNLAAMGASITPDAAAASLGVVAGYAYWRWLLRPGWSTAAFAGVALGLAELTKTTWIILFVIWPLMWLMWRFTHRRQMGAAPSLQAVQLATILLLAIYMINLAYAFQGSLTPLRNYRFISRALSGAERPATGDNRFARSWFAAIPVPFPKDYVRGIDVQRFDFEQKKWSFLRGEQKLGGWWYYYVYCAFVKTPVGIMAIVALALLLPEIRKRCSAGWPDLLVLLAPAVAVLILISSQTGFSRYYRYALPALPLIYIFASRVGLVFAGRHKLRSAIVAASLVLSIVESLFIAPHSLSFFNGFAGGPLGGHAHLLDANIDWGQDLLQLKRWQDAHPEAQPVHLAYFSDVFVLPRIAGIQWATVPAIDVHDGPYKLDTVDNAVPEPGWYAISVNHVYGYRHLQDDRPVYSYFQYLQPAARAGYSMQIYHVTPENAVRLKAFLETAPGAGTSN